MMRLVDTAPAVVPAPAVRRSCLHCGVAVPRNREDAFCCRGCRLVHGFLTQEGLTAYYDLGGRDGVPVPETRGETRDRKWLEVVEAERRADPSLRRVPVDIQGIHCTACVWLLGTMFQRLLGDGHGRVDVNSALGRAELWIDGSFPLRDWIDHVEAAGYVVGPAVRTENRAGDGLQIRLGVCLAIAMNAMMFAVAVYLGLRSGPVFDLIHDLGLVLALASVLIGGPVFFRGAWASIRQRSLHFDVPISMGILLAFGTSVAAFVAGRSDVYFDSVSVFIALMLLGRWWRDRALTRNRRTVLESGGVEHVLTRRIRDGARAIVPVTAIEEGDLLSVARGELVPVSARLLDRAASFSLDWITGEGVPREFAADSTVPAGAFNAGAAELTVVAETSFAASPLPGLIARRERGTGQGVGSWWDRTARRYVALVLVIAGAVALGWWWHTHDLWRVMEVTTSVLVITCPCAFGLAAPMVYELALAGLRRSGVFVRTEDFLDRARAVTRVVFDKTGTLTTGVLEVDTMEGSGVYDGVLLAMVEGSAHPKSVAVARVLRDRGVARASHVTVEELPGKGLSAELHGRRFLLGEPGWVRIHARDAELDGADVLFAVDGRVTRRFHTTEHLRPEAREEIAALQGRGYDVMLLSGDDPKRVAAMAEHLGLAADKQWGGQSPDDKARWIRAWDHHDTLMVGDGINDSLAVEAAWCSGTPAVDRPFMHERTDFYWTHPGISPVTLSLRVAKEVTQVLRALLTFAWAYNAGAIVIAALGLMKPWLAAVLMPTSSVLVLLGTRAALGRGARLWKS